MSLSSRLLSPRDEIRSAPGDFSRRDAQLRVVEDAAKSAAIDSFEKVDHPKHKLGDPFLLQRPRRNRGRGQSISILFWISLFPIALVVALIYLYIGQIHQKRIIIGILQTYCEGNCEAKLEGWLSRTLRLDWKSGTRRLDTIVVLDAAQKSKPIIYDVGIRYLKYPNRSGTYDVVNLSTGETTTEKESSPFYFR